MRSIRGSTTDIQVPASSRPERGPDAPCGIGVRFCQEGQVSTCNDARTVVRKTMRQIGSVPIVAPRSRPHRLRPSPLRTARPSRCHRRSRRNMVASPPNSALPPPLLVEMKTGACPAWVRPRRRSDGCGSGSCSGCSESALRYVSGCSSSRVRERARNGSRILRRRFPSRRPRLPSNGERLRVRLKGFQRTFLHVAPRASVFRRRDARSLPGATPNDPRGGAAPMFWPAPA